MSCKNCNHILSPDDNFCNKCGGKVVEKRLSIGYFIREFSEVFFSWEGNRPFRTFIDLLRCPEKVIDGYIQGVRKKYINPIGFAVISLTLTGLFFFVVQKISPSFLDDLIPSQNSGEMDLEGARQIQQLILEYQSLVFFAFVPIYALLTWIVFFNKRKYNYAEHLVLNLYAYAEVSIMTLLVFLMTIWNGRLFASVALLSVFFQIVFYGYILKRIFRLNFTQLIIKTLYFIGLVIPLYIIAVIIFVIIMIITGQVDGLIEANTP